jgi:hypothetical protein
MYSQLKLMEAKNKKFSFKQKFLFGQIVRKNKENLMKIYESREYGLESHRFHFLF